MRESVGSVEFLDLKFNIRSQIVVTRFPEEDMIDLFLDQGGDVEVGFARQNARQLLTFFQRAKGIPLTRDPVWLLVGRADFSSSDQTRSGSDDDPGTVYVESNGAMARLTIQPNNGAWMPYVATMGFDDLDKLSALLSRALDES